MTIYIDSMLLFLGFGLVEPETDLGFGFLGFFFVCGSESKGWFVFS